MFGLMYLFVHISHEYILDDPPLTAEQVEPMTVALLKVELRKRGLSFAGNKPILKQRLLDAILSNVSVRTTTDTRMYPNPEDGFSATAHWVELTPNQTAVENPTIEGFNAPTNRLHRDENAMYEFDETFERSVFSEKCFECELTRGGKSYKKNGRGKPAYTEKTRTKGRPRLRWLREHQLTSDSHPLDWVMALLMKRRRRFSDPKRSIFEDWTSWTNAKGILGNCGEAGGLYPTWKPFSISEIKQFVGIYILNGISISPRIEYKFRSQDVDPVNGSDLCNVAFGRDADRRFKQFRALFAVQDPVLAIPSRKVAPNHKIDPMLLQMLSAFDEAWDAGSYIAGDEQDAGFKGKHPDKARVTFKKEGDGFLIDALCDDGFTMTFYFRNMPAPKKWIDKGFSPTHSRILFMFEQLKGELFTCGLDNIYISAKFCRAALTEISQKVMTHGVCRTSGRGLPKSVLMQEKTTDTEKAAARGQVKAAVLKEDNLVSSIF